MEKEIKKSKGIRIVTDKDVKGFGYTRMTDDSCYYHVFALFIFMITWTTVRIKAKRQIAKFISPLHVEIDGKVFNLEYYGDLDTLPLVYYRNSLGTIVKAYKFLTVEQDKYAIFDEVQGKWVIVHHVDVYFFKPDCKMEGIIKGDTFIAIKELSVG